MRPMHPHVDYVTNPGSSADPLRFLLDALEQPGALLLLGTGAVGTIGLVLAWARWRPLEARGDA